MNFFPICARLTSLERKVIFLESKIGLEGNDDDEEEETFADITATKNDDDHSEEEEQSCLEHDQRIIT